MMIRFLKSRGARKFRRNRLAMGALVIIGLYALLTLWIIGVETVDYIGSRTATVNLQEHRVIGFLHANRAMERVGPPLRAGFFRSQNIARRTEQAEFFLNLAQQGLRETASLAPGGTRTADEILAATGVAERRLEVRPMAELREVLAAADADFAVMDEIRRKSGALNTVVITIDRLRPYDRRIAEAAARLARTNAEAEPEAFEAAAKRYDQVREDLGFKLEEIAFAVDDFIDREVQETSLHAIDLEPLFDAADNLQVPLGGLADAEAEAASFYDDPLLRQIRAEAQTTLRTLEPRIIVQMERIEAIVDELFPYPTGFDRALYNARTVLGTDRQGRSIFIRSLYSGKTAIQVGFIVAVLAVTFGSLLGAAAAFYGRWVDHAAIYFVSIFTAIPDLVLLVVLAFMFQAGDWSLPWDRDAKVANTLIPLYAAFAMTYWIGACRVIRGEALKIKELEYIQAARAVGFGRFYILMKHLIPNTTHLIFISFSLLFVAAIKGEVVLTFLGLGLKGGASWGLMIDDSQTEVVNGFFWQIGAATFFMLVLVLAFNVVSDALQDAFDPRHVG